MAGNIRHYFPGNNTPEGFFSYYHNILKPHEANKIWCIKGGPGVGKSTFMRKIGETMLEEGDDVDFLHCSSDCDSIDGIVLRKKKISIVDGTRPHIVDPVNPGAVDVIINLGDYWDEKEIRKYRKKIIETNERIRTIFARTYNYLAAAEKMYDNVYAIQGQRIKDGELYRIATDIINKELIFEELSPNAGTVKQFFASAITPSGIVNYIEGLIKDYHKVYLLQAPVGSGCEKILNPVLESALYRGFYCEAYYCPMKPAAKLEHLLIPSLSVAIVTSNRYHPIQVSNEVGNIIEINLDIIADKEMLSFQKEIQRDSLNIMEELLGKATQCLLAAKKEHDILEAYYIPNMNFNEIEALRSEIVHQIMGV